MSHKAHPEVWLDIEYVYPKYTEIEPDYDAVYQRLNTMLMGDGAPDLVVMDYLKTDTYAGKGLPADLSGILRSLEESGELMENITGAFVREDGRQYVVPLQCGFRMAMGRDIPVADMGSMEALVKFLSGQKASYLGDRTAEELADEFYPYFCKEIVDGFDSRVIFRERF